MMGRVFAVDYQFLSCGSVFTDGLAQAASDLDVPYMHAAWDDPQLAPRLRQFAPDLLFVVHGRKLWQSRGRELLKGYRSAVWLLDDPYEVDDTERFSKGFDHVFVNDPATLHRHRNASLLRVCYDPHRHLPPDPDAPRPHAVGFIGGGNQTRDRYLSALAQADLLTYVVGGDWYEPTVHARCRSKNITPDETAALYQQTRIVVNIFRERHHYNREQITAQSMNPRIYEALACGALVVSEWRPEIDALVPELPTFRSEAEAVALVQALLDDPLQAEAIRVQCAARLAGDTYAARLQTVIDVALGQREAVA